MADSIGNITVPEIIASGTFPIVPEYPYGGVSGTGYEMSKFVEGLGSVSALSHVWLASHALSFPAWLIISPPNSSCF